jgi:hypothetical protein
MEIIDLYFLGCDDVDYIKKNFRVGSSNELYERENNTLTFMKGGDFLVQICDYKLVKTDSTPWTSLKSCEELLNNVGTANHI